MWIVSSVVFFLLSFSLLLDPKEEGESFLSAATLANHPTVLFYQILHHAQTTATTIEEHTDRRSETYVQAYGDGIVGGRTGDYTRASYYPLVYAKGALFLDALRSEMGDEAFFTGLQTYYGQYKYRVATPENLLGAMENAHGQRLGEFHKRWESTAHGT